MLTPSIENCSGCPLRNWETDGQNLDFDPDTCGQLQELLYMLHQYGVSSEYVDYRNEVLGMLRKVGLPCVSDIVPELLMPEAQEKYPEKQICFYNFHPCQGIEDCPYINSAVQQGANGATFLDDKGNRVSADLPPVLWKRYLEESIKNLSLDCHYYDQVKEELESLLQELESID